MTSGSLPIQQGPAASVPMTADVFLESNNIDADTGLLLDMFSMAGITAQVRIVPPRRNAVTLGWVVLATLPLHAFLSTIGAKAAEASYAKLRTAIQRLTGHHDSHEPPCNQPHPLILQDSNTGLQIVLEPELPADAYRQLTALDLTQFRMGPVHYDQQQQRWRSELDEATHD